MELIQVGREQTSLLPMRRDAIAKAAIRFVVRVSMRWTQI
jgi:hypothetical protein